MGQKRRTAGQGLKLLLIRDYLYNEASKDRPKNARQIQKFLQEYRIAASTKTIYTDISRLRDDLEIPIEYSGKGGRGYYIAEKPFDPAELRLLIDCIRNAEFITKDDATTLTDKIVGLASSPDKELLTRHLEEEYKKSQTEASVIENVNLLMKAIDANRKISFNRYRYVAEHTKHTSLEKEVIIASPVRLVRKSNQYVFEYLKELDDGGYISDQIHVSMMDNIEILGDANRYTKAENKARQQAMEEVLDDFWGKKRAITIQFYNRASDKILNKLPEDAILIKVNASTSKTTIMERVSPAFFSWLDDFGTYAKILAPEDVIEKFLKWQKQKLYDYAGKYGVNIDDIHLDSEDDIDDDQGEVEIIRPPRRK